MFQSISGHNLYHFRSRSHIHLTITATPRRSSCEDARREASLIRSQGRLSPRQVKQRGVWPSSGGGTYWGQVRTDQSESWTGPPPPTTPLAPESHLLRMSRQHSAAERIVERLRRLQCDPAFESQVQRCYALTGSNYLRLVCYYRKCSMICLININVWLNLVIPKIISNQTVGDFYKTTYFPQSSRKKFEISLI